MAISVASEQSYVCVVSNGQGFALFPKGEAVERELKEYGPVIDEFGDSDLPDKDGIYLWKGQIVYETPGGFMDDETDWDLSFEGDYTRLESTEFRLREELFKRGITLSYLSETKP